jgi:hypothetical protein
MFRDRIENVVRAAGGDWFGTCGTLPAPGHSKHDRGISVTIAPNRPHGILVNGFNCDPLEAYWYVLDLLGIDKSVASLEPFASERRLLGEHHQRQARKAEDFATKIARIIGECRPIAGTLAEDYLLSRGIRPPYPSALRYHPRVWTRDKAGELGHSHAMVSIVTRKPGGPGVALHRTFLTRDGGKNQNVEAVRKMLGPCKCAGVWPDELGEVLAIAEGVETALSFQKLSSVPSVAALDAGKIAHVEVPDSVRELIIAADHDHSGTGLKAAKAAMRKHWKPWRLVRVLMPNRVGDFNDLLTEGRCHG